MKKETRRDQKRPDNATHRRKTILDSFGLEERIIGAAHGLLAHTDDPEARYRIRDGAQLAIVRLGGV